MAKISFFDKFYFSLKAVYDFNGKYEGRACLNVCMCVCLCMYVCMYVCIYVCMYVLFADQPSVFRLKPSYFVYKFIFCCYRLNIQNIKLGRKRREIDIKLR